MRTPPAPQHRGIAAALMAAFMAAWLVLAALWPAAPAHAQTTPGFTDLTVVRNEQGLFASFNARFDLPRAVEDALSKGVPLYFVVEAALYSKRWYWADKREARTSRVWRLAYQPLTRKYRVTLGGESQIYDTQAEALAVVRRVSDWKIADAGQIDKDESHYVEFAYRLDTTLLSRPMQIGIGGQPEWTLVIEKTLPLE